ncbi:glycosyl transferase [Bacteroidia bacterium]|nr:glycosyl transferase [Bacteroidia bacterium]GHT26664.1 glycosyl transferase [Bacteroidia bacterium]
MLSICIPIYNYEVTRLVHDLHRQAEKIARPFEILLMDDASDEKYKLMNQTLDLTHVRYIPLKKNIGRAKIRNQLAREAQYPYLLFMDCDSAVSSDFYIENYLPYCNPQTVCYGGRKYEDKQPEDDTYLRWKYGMERESLPAEIRKKNPNYSFCTNNFLIHKQLFEKVKFNENLEGYGHEDTFFGLELLEKGIIIQHIDNPLIHLGLESAADFLEKTENGIVNLQKIETLLKENNPEHVGHSNLMKSKLFLQKWHLIKLAATLFKPAQPSLKKHLLGKNPSLRIFDLYKLGLICAR